MKRDLAYYKALFGQLEIGAWLPIYTNIELLATTADQDQQRAVFDLYNACRTIETAELHSQPATLPTMSPTSETILRGMSLLEGNSIHQTIRVVSLLSIRIDGSNQSGAIISIVMPHTRNSSFEDIE